jgi:hypothetical protein
LPISRLLLALPVPLVAVSSSVRFSIEASIVRLRVLLTVSESVPGPLSFVTSLRLSTN